MSFSVYSDKRIGEWCCKSQRRQHHYGYELLLYYNDPSFVWEKSYNMSSTHYYATLPWQSDCYAPYYHTLFILFYSVFVPLDGKQRWRWQYFPVMNLSWLSKLRYILFTVAVATTVSSRLDKWTARQLYQTIIVSEMFLERYLSDGYDGFIRP